MTSTTQDAPKAVTDWRGGLIVAWFGAAMPLLAVSSAALALNTDRSIADLLLLRQDLVPLGGIAAFVMFLRFVPASALAWGGRVADVLARRPGRIGGAAALLAALVAAVGWFVVFRGYALSMDEFMAVFDTAIFRRGHLAAPLAPEWRDLAEALQPQFTISTPDHDRWASFYLPVNAAVRALFALVGAPWLAGALWAATAVAATYGVARQLWPQRPDAAAVAAVFTLTSAQFLVTAMTPYAMSAHLALNMVWLWLFLRGDRRGDFGALTVGFLATGLHQFIFHPLFAAPFVASLWLSRRWGRTAVFTAGYAAICLFWVLYWKLTLPAAAPLGAKDAGISLLLSRVVDLLAKADLTAVGTMGKNLLRFLCWQNPLAPTLALMGAAAAVRREPSLRCLVAGAALTLAAMALLMPFQGHGWGYRYLHGFLGGLALAAAFGWVRLTETGDEVRRSGAGAVLALAGVFSLLVLAPLRSAQAGAFVRPYAASNAAIEGMDADLVIIDSTGLFYAADLVRNDPWLQGRPKRLDLQVMTEEQVKAACARGRVALFDKEQGLAAGIEPVYGPPTPAVLASRRALERIGCAR